MVDFREAHRHEQLMSREATAEEDGKEKMGRREWACAVALRPPTCFGLEDIGDTRVTFFIFSFLSIFRFCCFVLGKIEDAELAPACLLSVLLPPFSLLLLLLLVSDPS
ncbi:hypothetical protein BC567DRAFT_12504 [Phyllosticta citribraziliensis]